MSVMSDKWIRAKSQTSKMIDPFEEKQLSEGVISYGLSSYGYDIRISDEFRIFTNVHSNQIDPKKFNPQLLEIVHAPHVLIPPNSFCLARTVEYFKIPRNVITICVGKSTYARCGILINVTPFEPGWEGFATMEISNITPCPAKIYANEGIAQVLFFEGNEYCETTYADRAGKYQYQMELTLPFVKETK